VRRGAWCGVAVAAALTCGCAETTPGDKVKDDLATMKAERTPDKLLDRGLAFASVGDMTRAEQYLAAALEAGADPRVVLPPLLKVCIAAKRYRVAIDYAMPTLRKHPRDAHLRYVVASLRASVGDAVGARADLGKVIELEPSDPRARFAYAVLLRDQCGDLPAADEQFRAYLALEPQGEHAEEAQASLLKPVKARSADEGTEYRDLKAVP
jgi:Tfp pilus assembly protein PilF